MKPLLVLLAIFGISLLTLKVTHGKYQFASARRIALSAMLIFTAIGHFAFTKGMSLMIPEFIPFKTEIVYLTGIVEIIFAIGLFFPIYRNLTAWLLIVFLIMVLPANVYASIKHLDYQKATFDGNGLIYLWFRIPLQMFFIGWTYFSCINNQT